MLSPRFGLRTEMHQRGTSLSSTTNSQQRQVSHLGSHFLNCRICHWQLQALSEFLSECSPNLWDKQAAKFVNKQEWKDDESETWSNTTSFPAHGCSRRDKKSSNLCWHEARLFCLFVVLLQHTRWSSGWSRKKWNARKARVEAFVSDPLLLGIGWTWPTVVAVLCSCLEAGAGSTDSSNRHIHRRHWSLKLFVVCTRRL